MEQWLDWRSMSVLKCASSGHLNPELSQKNVKVVYQVLGWQFGIVALLKWTVYV